jgi:uncharacterized protein (TIGR02594 family)
MTVSPPWLLAAQSYLGVKEVPGPKHSNVILGWLRGLKAWWSDDEMAWCGTFVAHCLKEADLPFPDAWYRARAYENYGSLLRRERLSPGAILIFLRQGGGHVGFYVGEDDTHYHVLGGNQSNGVNVMRLAKHRLFASRWPTGYPVVGGPVMLASSSAKISGNEA